ncbi:MAG: hypothetical protein KC649_01400 [Candidatus Omnitrophica bacterium]|nr:hypothetical protein [Candidatus Omnitrophota bacterium]
MVEKLQMGGVLSLTFEQRLKERFFEFAIESESSIYSKEWFSGSVSEEWIPYYRRDVDKCRFALMKRGVLYLSVDSFRIDFEISEYFKQHKSRSISVLFNQLLRRLQDPSIKDKRKQHIKGPFRLMKGTKLLNLTNDDAISRLNSLWNSTVNNKENLVITLVQGNRQNNVYKRSCLFAERIYKSGFNGIAYQPGTIVTDVMGPCNDPMIVLFEPEHGTKLFEQFI